MWGVAYRRTDPGPSVWKPIRRHVSQCTARGRPKALSMRFWTIPRFSAIIWLHIQMNILATSIALLLAHFRIVARARPHFCARLWLHHCMWRKSLTAQNPIFIWKGSLVWCTMHADPRSYGVHGQWPHLQDLCHALLLKVWSLFAILVDNAYGSWY